LRILYDTQIFDWQVNGGISRYFVELFNGLDTHTEANVLFKCRHSYNTYIQDTRWLQFRPVANNLHFKGKLSLIKYLNQRMNRGWSNSQLRKQDFDIFHPTYYDPYFLKHIGVKPYVLTVYDLINEKFNDDSPLTKIVLSWKRELITRAAHIIAISDNTRKDLINYYGITPEKVTTVYLSGGFEKTLLVAPSELGMKKFPSNFILFVGSRVGYKNFSSFVKELSPLLKKFQLSLITVGGGKYSSSEQKLFTEFGISSLIYSIPHASDRLLVQLYKQARIFVFPSYYEGFGLPVLEALQCGCPVLLSNNSSLPEVGGSAAHYFDPFTEGDMQVQLAHMLSDRKLIQTLKSNVPVQLARFSWEQTVKGHLDVYNKVVL
jgi:glycosyltransferase involved in cell wall biosynthesis